MTDLRSGLCHGPGCNGVVSSLSPSEDFCSERCAARWNGAYEPPRDRITLTPPSLYDPPPDTWVPLDDDPLYPDWVWTPRRVEPVTVQFSGGREVAQKIRDLVAAGHIEIVKPQPWWKFWRRNG